MSTNPVQIVPMVLQKERKGILGFGGTKREGHVTNVDAQQFYVDSGHALASDDNYGTDPENPLATIQELVDRSTGTSVTRPALENYSTVWVSGNVTEDVQTGDYTEMPSYVSIIGVGNSRYSPAWEGDDSATPSLDLRCVGWRISGFRFYGKATAPAVVLRHTDTGANDIAIRTQIDNCLFDGLTTGLYGIETHGCYDVWVINCTFTLWNNVGNTATGFKLLTAPLALPYRQQVVGCHFFDNDNGMDVPQNGSHVRESTFQKTGYAYASVLVCQTNTAAAGGDDNMLTDNRFEGDFAIAGGYRFGPADFVMSNFSDDVAEAEVGAEGLVIAVPT